MSHSHWTIRTTTPTQRKDHLMAIRKYPAHTNREDINLALANLGFDSETVVSMTIDERGIDAEVQAYDAQGNLVTMYVDGEQVAASYSVFIPHPTGEQQ